MLAQLLDPPLDPLADVVEAIDRLQAENLRLDAGSELGHRLKTLRSAINRLEAESARTLGVFDGTQAYAAAGSLSAASWLRHRGLAAGPRRHRARDRLEPAVDASGVSQ